MKIFKKIKLARFKKYVQDKRLADHCGKNASIGNEIGSSGLEITEAVPCSPRVSFALRVGATGRLAVVAVGCPDFADVVALDVIAIIEFPTPLNKKKILIMIVINYN
jgi:hypothetical protein